MANHGEKTKIYLSQKIEELEKHIKDCKRKNTAIHIAYGSFITISIVSSTVVCIISSLAVPPLAIAAIASIATVSTAFSTRFNLKSRKEKLTKSIKKLNILKDKLGYVVTCNGNMTEEECSKILEEFRIL